MTAQLPGAAIDEVPHEASAHATYTALLREDVLAFQGCGACAGAVFPPRQRCPLCGSDALAWRRSAGLGTVYSATVIQPRNDPAYCVVLVDVDEGYRMMSRITEADAASVSIDDRVDVRFQHDDDRVLPLFAPTTGDQR